MIRSRAARSAAVVVAALAAPAPDAAAGCRPDGAAVVARSETAEVLRVTRTRGRGRDRSTTTRYYGCARGRRRALFLGPRSSDADIETTFVRRFVVRGTVAAYEEVVVRLRPPVRYRVRLRDLRTGRALRLEPATADGTDARDYAVRKIVLGPGTSVAWTARNPTTNHYELHRADRLGRTLLDSAAGLEAKSLTLSGRELAWRVDGVRKTARLE